jgi:hypothetical protein
MAVAADASLGRSLARVPLSGQFAGREFQQPLNGRHAHGMGEVMKLLLGVDQQVQNRQELLAVPGEEFNDRLLAVCAIGNVRFHQVVSLERGV